MVTGSGQINRLSVDWTGVVARPQPNGQGHLTGAIGGIAGSAFTVAARCGPSNVALLMHLCTFGPSGDGFGRIRAIQ
jgi:hypothetical protein